MKLDPANYQLWKKIRNRKYVSLSEARKLSKDIVYQSCPRGGLVVKGLVNVDKVLRNFKEENRLLKVEDGELSRLKKMCRFKGELVIYKTIDTRLN